MKMMIIIIYFCVIFSSSTAHGEGDNTTISALQTKLEKEGIINDIFRPAEGGLLGIGFFGVTYKGKLLHPIEKEVAMKFTQSVNAESAMKEYEIYTYLNAINNTDAERYGIPSVYYYGTWDGYIMMAITLLHVEFNVKAKKGEITEVDILIIFREFVRITKYIHSHGVHHNDIKFDNMMFRKHQGFIIDYNIAGKLYRKRHSQALNYYHRSKKMTRKNGIRYAREDWGSFLQSMCHFVGVHFYWFNFGSMDNVLSGDLIKKDIPNTMKGLAAIEHDGLRRVYVELAEYVFRDYIRGDCSNESRGKQRKRDTLNYDNLFQSICEEIEKSDLPKPVLVSWLTDEQRKEAVEDLQKSPTPDISSIRNPIVMLDEEYPKVNFNYFSQQNK